MTHYQKTMAKLRISTKPNKLYVIRKVLIRAIKSVIFMEFEPLYQKLREFLPNIGSFYNACSLNMVISRDPRCNSENVLFCPNSAFNIRKRHKISSGKTL